MRGHGSTVVAENIQRAVGRTIYLEQAGQTPQLITYAAPEPDPERPVLFDAEVQVDCGPKAGSPAARLRLLGLVADDHASGRQVTPPCQAAHRSSFAAS